MEKRGFVTSALWYKHYFLPAYNLLMTAVLHCFARGLTGQSSETL